MEGGGGVFFIGDGNAVGCYMSCGRCAWQCDAICVMRVRDFVFVHTRYVDKMDIACLPACLPACCCLLVSLVFLLYLLLAMVLTGLTGRSDNIFQ